MVSTRSLLLSGGSPKTTVVRAGCRFSLYSSLQNLGRLTENAHVAQIKGDDFNLKSSWVKHLGFKTPILLPLPPLNMTLENIDLGDSTPLWKEECLGKQE